MLSNAYCLAKFRFDTAENEPAKKLKILQKIAEFASRYPAPRRVVSVSAPRMGLASPVRVAPGPPALSRVAAPAGPADP